ncbi:hypothetical protein FNF31_03989 [Cafeteria roenbergensis]|uniref:UEV domain-containing protein n=1 Tax=Cafeteria roenbergensis TaxID=33653 RepID=A0A5A8D7J3_CAFRO|nr:hypothetical protein FNF31_03989 [Cafeteria roenbergensis]KAA0170836.1 hypothetical protein FNF28_01109 [Cafeteria roenbergensis]
MQAPNEAALDRAMAGVQYADAKRVRRDVLEAMRQAPYLIPKQDELFQEVSPGDWQPCKLLSLEGVLAYSHSSSVYYCPIQMYVQTKHPRSKPTVYVRPTPDMMIERGAEYVDKAGQITIPSLTSYTESTGLAAVLREMAFIFATAPPVRSRPSAAAMAGAGAASGSRAESQSRDASALRARVTEALKRDLGQWYDALGEALSKEEVVGATLREDKRAMAGKAESGAASLRKLEEHVKTVHEQTEQLDRWLAASEAGMSDIDAEAAVTPAHRLHKQLLDAVVEVNTVDDVIDALQAALENDAISLDEFVKEVRARSRSQFEARCVAAAIHEALAKEAAMRPAGHAAAAAGSSAAGSRGAPPPYETRASAGYPSAPAGPAPPAYGSAPPAYGSGPPPYGSGPPPYGSGPPPYGSGPAGPGGSGPQGAPPPYSSAGVPSYLTPGRAY